MTSWINLNKNNDWVKASVDEGFRVELFEAVLRPTEDYLQIFAYGQILSEAKQTSDNVERSGKTWGNKPQLLDFKITLREYTPSYSGSKPKVPVPGHVWIADCLKAAQGSYIAGVLDLSLPEAILKMLDNGSMKVESVMETFAPIKLLGDEGSYTPINLLANLIPSESQSKGSYTPKETEADRLLAREAFLLAKLGYPDFLSLLDAYQNLGLEVGNTELELVRIILGN